MNASSASGLCASVIVPSARRGGSDFGTGGGFAEGAGRGASTRAGSAAGAEAGAGSGGDIGFGAALPAGFAAFGFFSAGAAGAAFFAGALSTFFSAFFSAAGLVGRLAPLPAGAAFVDAFLAKRGLRAGNGGKGTRDPRVHNLRAARERR